MLKFLITIFWLIQVSLLMNKSFLGNEIISLEKFYANNIKGTGNFILNFVKSNIKIQTLNINDFNLTAISIDESFIIM